MPERRCIPERRSDPVDAAAFGCRRFWLPRGTFADFSDGGFLVDPESSQSMFVPSSAVPFEALEDYSVLGLLGEPGMGKSTVLNQEARRLAAIVQQNGDRLLRVDLAACGTDVLVSQEIFQSKEWKSWNKSKARLYLLLDGFDTCLHYVENLVALLLEGLQKAPRDRLSLRIACRTADWPPDLETELEKLWREQEQAVGVYELAPLRQKDVRALAEAAGCSAVGFLGEVASLGAAQFANRPITLRFLLDTFHSGKGLPQRRSDLYREGCLVLCDEWRHDLRRGKRPLKLSSGLRFSVAGRLAAASVFSRKAALWTAPRHEITPQGDVRIDELFGGPEHFEREVAEVHSDEVKETLQFGLFRSVGPSRIAFSHQTYAEFLAAQYLVDHALDVPKILQLVLHPDGSGKVVSQLRETAAWLAELVPEVRSRILETDPEVLFASDTPPTSEEDRRTLVRQILRLFDEGELFDIQPVAAAGKQQDGTRLRFAGIAKDLRPYIIDKSKRSIARRAAILMAQYTQQVELEQDLVYAALDNDEAQDVRAAAAVAVRLIGSESSRAALKPLVTISPSNDPGDELKGAGLAAAWPKYLTADELFDALTPPRTWKPAGEYQRFLASDFAVHLRPSDMLRGLQWARIHSTRAPGEFDPLSSAAFEVVIAAVDCCNNARVCDCIAEILVELARLGVPESRLMRKLSSQQDARSSIARAAIRVAQDLWTMRCLRTLGLVEDGDVSFLLAELQGAPPSDLQQKIGFLITNILYWGPSVYTDLFEQVLTVARANPVFFAALKPVLGPIELGSEEAKDQQASFKSRRQADPPSEPRIPPNFEDIVSAVDSSNVMAFAEIYRRLRRTSWGPDDDLLPEWEKLKPDLQAQILRSAEAYLTGHRVADTSWIERGETWDTVAFGYRAMRLLAQVAPEILKSLCDDIFNAWMPCVFGDTYTRKVPDHAQTAILKAAYLRAPARFRELLCRFIDAQDKRSGEIFFLDRLAPVWDNEIVGILRTRLEDGNLSPCAFRSVLACLMRAGEAVAARIANDIVASAGEACPALLERSVQVALEVLDQDPASGWQVVWPVARANSAVAESLFENLAQVPYGSDTTRVLNGLHENDLAELLIWLLQHELRAEGCGEAGTDDHRDEPFAMMSANDNWRWLRVMALNNLIQRGTPAATEAIRKLKEAFPNENLDPVEKDSEEFVRQKTWTPLTPSEFLDFVLTPDPSHSVESNPSYPDSPLPPAVAIPIKAAAETRIFRKSGDFWDLKFGGESVLVRSSKGMKYIAELLQCPGKDVHVSQLLGAVEGQGGDLWLGSAGIVLDETARRQYKKRWQELKNERAKAEHSGDWNRLERIEEEQDQLKGQLASAIGLGGRDRKADDDVERLRKRVSRAISTAIRAIGKHHRQLADHLSSHVEPGQFCSYRGDGIDWQL